MPAGDSPSREARRMGKKAGLPYVSKTDPSCIFCSRRVTACRKTSFPLAWAWGNVSMPCQGTAAMPEKMLRFVKTASEMPSKRAADERRRDFHQIYADFARQK